MRLSRSSASRYSFSAAAPSCSSARQRATIPSATSLPQGSAVSSSRSRALAGEVIVARVGGRLDELWQCPHATGRCQRRPEDGRGRLPRGGRRLFVAGEAVVEDRGRPVGMDDCGSLSAGPRMLECRCDEPGALGLVALQCGKSKRWVGGDLAPCRRGDRVALSDDRGGPREVAHPRGRNSQLPEVEREVRERAGVTDELDVPSRDVAHALDVPHETARLGRDPAPLHHVIDRDVGELLRCPPQGRSRGNVPLGRQQREAVEQQVDGAGIAIRGRERLDGAADLQADVRVGEVSCDAGGAPGGDVRRSRARHIERLRAVVPPQEAAAERHCPDPRRTRHGPALGLLSPAGTRRGARTRPRPRIRAPCGTRRPAGSLVPQPVRGSARRVGSIVSSAARRRNAAAAATPPRACARPAERSSSAAISSSGPADAWARCQARRSGPASPSVTSARARCTRWRSSAVADAIRDGPNEWMREPHRALQR